MPWLWSVEEEELKEDSGDSGDRCHGCGPWRATTEKGVGRKR